MEKFIDYTRPNFGTDKILDFTLYSDFHCQSLFWTDGKTDIYASPQWDDLEGLCALQIQNITDLSEGFEFSLGEPYNLEAQNQRYLAIVSDLIEALGKPYSNLDTLIQNVLNNY
jgi:hypothetical protein